MTFTLPPAPKGHIFQLQAASDEYTGDDVWFVRLRRKIWFFYVTVAARRIDELTQDSVTVAANLVLMDVYASGLAQMREHTRKMLNDEQKRSAHGR